MRVRFVIIASAGNFIGQRLIVIWSLDSRHFIYKPLAAITKDL